MEFERKSSGVAKAGLTTGIIGTSLGTLGLLGAGANGLGNLLGGTRTSSGVMDGYIMGMAMANQGCHSTCGCSEDHLVTRYEAQKDAEIAKLKSDIALRDADTYTDQKILELYQYIDGRLRGVEGQLAQQAVLNQATNDKFQLAEQKQQCCCDRLETAIKAERDARCCGLNSLVDYVNTTFYPKLVADITTGTTTQAQTLFNPVPNCGCDCG